MNTSLEKQIDESLDNLEACVMDLGSAEYSIFGKDEARNDIMELIKECSIAFTKWFNINASRFNPMTSDEQLFDTFLKECSTKNNSSS